MSLSTFVKTLQRDLNAQGESLVVDGVPGPKTKAALKRLFKKALSPPQLPPSNEVKKIEVPANPKPGQPIYPSPHPYHPRFDHLLPKPYTHLHPFDVLRSVAGEKEIPGKKDNPLIAHFHEHSGNLGKHDDHNDYSDEVPHCSSALNWAADMAGCVKSNNALASSWVSTGFTRQGDWVEVGDIIIKKTWSEKSKKYQWHVTLCNKRFNRKTAKTYEGFGSNQGNTIKTSTYLVSEIVSVRVWVEKEGTVLAPIGILGHKPVPATGKIGEQTT